MFDQLRASFWTPVEEALPLVVAVMVLGPLIEYLISRRSKVPRPWFLYGLADGLIVASMIVISAITLTPDPLTGIDVTQVEIADGGPAPDNMSEMFSTQSDTQLVPFESIIESITHSVSISVPISQIGGNAVLFLPTALLITARFGLSVLRGTLISIGLVVLIEVMQYLLPVARVASVDDVIIATLGILVGAVLGRLLNSVLPRHSSPPAMHPSSEATAGRDSTRG